MKKNNIKKFFGCILMALLVFVVTTVIVDSIRIAALVWGIAIIVMVWFIGAFKLLTSK